MTDQREEVLTEYATELFSHKAERDAAMALLDAYLKLGALECIRLIDELIQADETYAKHVKMSCDRKLFQLKTAKYRLGELRGGITPDGAA